MEYVDRKLEEPLREYLLDSYPRGAIVAGIVGVGKTTMIHKVLGDLDSHFAIFKFSGDDIRFRRLVTEDSRYLIKDIRSKTNERALVFVDEIQKTPEILDALKLAYDEEGISFVVSGSEPQYLLQEAQHRLQRRARAFSLFPFSLNEIYADKGLCDLVTLEEWKEILAGALPDKLLSKKGDWAAIRKHYKLLRATGTIPLVMREKSVNRKRLALRSILERGYFQVAGLSQEQFDIIQTELANLNNREFVYQTIFNKTRLSRREKINAAIDSLISKGILVKKKRKIFVNARSSYHVIYSFVDPGLAAYLVQTGSHWSQDDGYDLESVVFSQLLNWGNVHDSRLKISYFTPYIVTPSRQIKYRDGQVDFIIEGGLYPIPVEVKSSDSLNRINTRVLSDLMKMQDIPFGIVFYQGSPWLDREKNIYYFPLALL